MGGVPAIAQRVSQTEQMGRKGVEWATMLRDELSWQDEMEEAEEAEEGEEAGDSPAVDGADGDKEEEEDEQVREAVGAAPEDAPAAPGDASGRSTTPPRAGAPQREEALAKQRKDSLAAAVSDATGGAPEEGVPGVAGGQPEPEPEPSATGEDSSAADSSAKPGAEKGKSSKKSARAPNKIGNQPKDDAPSLSQQDADQLREILKRLEEFDQVCGKVRAAGDKPTAMRYAARRKELCKELATPVTDALDIQESHYAAMHARLQRIAASLKKLEMKAAELLAAEEMQEEEEERAGTQLAVVGRALSGAEDGSERKSATQQDMEDAQVALEGAMQQWSAAETPEQIAAADKLVEQTQVSLTMAEQKVEEEVVYRQRVMGQMEAAEAAMQKAVSEHNDQAVAEAKAQMELARLELEAVAEKEAAEQRLRDERVNAERLKKNQREGDLADGLMQLGGPSMVGAPPPTQAGRERLRATLEQAMVDFDANFNTMPDAMSCLGEPVLQLVATLRTMTTADTDAVAALLMRGRDLSSDESTSLQHEVSERESERDTTMVKLMDELRKAQAICAALMQAAKLYLEAERARVAGERLAALEALQHEQTMLLDATSQQKKGGAGGPGAAGFSPGQGLEPGSIEELNAMLVPKDEAAHQKAAAQAQVSEAERIVMEAGQALDEARENADISQREGSAAAIHAAEKQLAAAESNRVEKERARESAKQEHAALIDSKTATKLVSLSATT